MVKEPEDGRVSPRNIFIVVDFPAPFGPRNPYTVPLSLIHILAGFAGLPSLHPVFIALACLAGGISIGHVNDSGFWVVTNMSGYTVKGGLKSYTIGGAFIALFTIIVCIIAALFTH